MRARIRADKCEPAGGKTKFISAERAERVMERLWRSPTTDGRHGRMPRKVYRCDHCGWWHLSSGDDDRSGEEDGRPSL